MNHCLPNVMETKKRRNLFHLAWITGFFWGKGLVGRPRWKVVTHSFPKPFVNKGGRWKYYS